MILLNDLRRDSGLRDEIVSALAAVASSGWYILGDECRRFEEEFAAYCGAAAGIGVGNGTDALELALRAAGVKAGDRVVTVANAGMYSTTAIKSIGANPVFVDVEEDSLLMSPERLREVNLAGIAAVVVTHLYGRMANMPEILQVAASTAVPVIYFA